MAACIASILDSGGMPLKGGKMDKINASDLSVHEFSNITSHLILHVITSTDMELNNPT